MSVWRARWLPGSSSRADVRVLVRKTKPPHSVVSRLRRQARCVAAPRGELDVDNSNKPETAASSRSTKPKPAFAVVKALTHYKGTPYSKAARHVALVVASWVSPDVRGRQVGTVSQQTLADETGLTRETVCRVLKKELGPDAPRPVFNELHHGGCHAAAYVLERPGATKPYQARTTVFEVIENPTAFVAARDAKRAALLKQQQDYLHTERVLLQVAHQRGTLSAADYQAQLAKRERVARGTIPKAAWDKAKLAPRRNLAHVS